ncbi:hypothetical protein BO221_46155 [Archangium sp. Cb G35]|uniref:DUF1521 domain-containing protein n=1 Tax=Archangium sp. Cb G35 TaxID=1920190 RepID=UPI0009360071|nr:DUF1521 domain-containing protein [Archangium sp. Cb G35]OJT17493.1 hypothetical protein BO221_46155 [Archangium sp. Cb G35]
MSTKIGGSPNTVTTARTTTAELQTLGATKDAGQVQTTAATTAANAANNTVETDVFRTDRSIMDIFYSVVGNGGPATPTPPAPSDSSHPSGSLKTDKNGVITTPGGYKIEATSQFEWKITGPDGKNTRVWGDPHVDEGDGGKWDFKRDSTFVLGDGTRINCTTAPYGNGMTVSAKLEIISGNDRVQVTDIDKGKGKTGPVTQDGFAHANSFGNKDVFVMGKETDDWSFTGKEIVGSNNGGESFKLGNDLAPGNTKPAVKPSTTKPGGFFGKLGDLFNQMSKLFDSLRKLTEKLEKNNPFERPTTHGPRGGCWVDRRQATLKNSFEDIGRMMDKWSSLSDLTRSINQNRFRTF